MRGPTAELHLVVPGPLEQRTGGYLYDARMAEGLRRLGWTVTVHSLEGAFPDGDARAEASLENTLSSLPAGSRALLDGLAMGSLPAVVRRHAERLVLLSLVHHPLADETGLDPGERERLGALEREALAACRGVVVTSAFTRERLAGWGVPAARVRVVPPGTDPAPAAAGPGADAPPALLSVGSVTPRKGQDVLVRALARLGQLPWTCLCAGSLERAPEFARAVLAAVEEAGLDGRIRFLGERSGEEVAGLYHRASLFVLPSWYEGFGMALAEALARGLPVVATDAGAIPGTVPGDAGVLVPPGDHLALAAALEALLAGEEGARRRAELAAGARRHGLALTDWEEAARSLARAIGGLAGGG